MAAPRVRRGVLDRLAFTDSHPITPRALPLLFSYGPLQQTSLQLSLLGRRLAGALDALPGYEPTRLRIDDPAVVAAVGATHHANVRLNGNRHSRVPGTVFEVTDEELALVDDFERESGFGRVKATLSSGKQAWVYMHGRETTEAVHKAKG
jgi:hypothetical protein